MSSNSEPTPAGEPARPATREADSWPAWSGSVVGRILGRLVIGDPDSLPIAVELPDGTSSGASRSRCVGSVRIRNWAALAKILADPEYQLGACYVSGEVEVLGDLTEVLEIANRSLPQKPSRSAELRHRLRRYRWAIAPARARRNICHHYDVGNEFYALWLDPSLTYTCAYFRTPAVSLADAQREKMELVCVKLGLRPGERVVEAGSGWGSLALHMAEHHGVRVTAFNISPTQTRYARQQAHLRGVADRVEFVEGDYRDITGRYDAFVSVGMLEHVGERYYRELGRIIDRSLIAGGRGLIHSIGRHRHFPPNPWMQRTIFPEAYVPSLREMMDVFETGGLAIHDIENLRPHYALTLENWLRQFEAHSTEVERMFDAAFVRAWRLYLASSIASFRTGWHQLYQIVFARAVDVPSLPSRTIRRYRGVRCVTVGVSAGRTPPSSSGA